MGTYNAFTMNVTVPASAVGPLAADLREMMGERPWYPEDQIMGASDADLVAWMLYEAEGGSDDYGQGPNPEFTAALEAQREDGSVVVQSGGYGKLSFSGDKVEGLYAANGAVGTIECELDDGIGGRYVLVLRDGGVEVYEAQLVYPRTDTQSRALALFCQFLQGEAQQTFAALTNALVDVAEEAVQER